MDNKVYSKPVVEAIQVQMSSIIMVGSEKGLGIGDPISGGEGG
jgi:hypothetical protein